MRTTLPSIIAFLAYAGYTHAKQQPLLGAVLKDYTCPEHSYTVNLFSKNPLVIYISNFITNEEAAHLEAITDGHFTKSEIVDESGRQQNATTRTSRSTSPPRDAVIRCIEERALAFQGLGTERTRLEPLQLVRYSPGEQYRTHTDWFESSSQMTAELGGNRVSSFFVYVAAGAHAGRQLSGGGTNFPLLNAPADEAWCRLVDCDEPWDSGVTFRARPGNAVFWENLLPDGSGNRAVLHAGLPVTSGSKLGMNIWTRERPLSAKYRGDD